MFRRKGFIYLAILAMLGSNVVYGNDLTVITSNNSHAAAFLKIGVGARALGMGGAYTALSDDASASYWNPAGFAEVSGWQIMAMHNEWLQDIKHEFLGYAQNPMGKSALGGSVNYLYINDLEEYDNSGNSVGSFKAYDLSCSGSYARKLSSKTSIGISLKTILSKIDDEGGGGVALDIGELYKVNDTLKLGCVVQNIGPKIKFIEEGYNLPLTIKAGLVQSLLDKDLIVTMDFGWTDDWNVRCGFEYWLANIVALRGGYIYEEDSDIKGLSAGVGVMASGLGIDYAYTPYEELGEAHRISATFSWDMLQSPRGKTWQNICPVCGKSFNNPNALAKHQTLHPPAQTEEKFGIYKIVVSNVEADRATILWLTEIPATTEIYYGETSSLGKVKKDDILRLQHRVEISGLESNTTYYYQIVSVDMRNNNSVNPVLTFTTN